MKDVSAGLVAGLVIGFLFIAMWYFVIFLAFGGKLSLQGIAAGLSETQFGGRLGSVETVTFFLLFGVIVGSIVCAGVGAILGVVFVKSMFRLAFPSIHLKALVFGCVIYFVVSLENLRSGKAFDLYLLISMVIDSQLFCLLFGLLMRR